MFKSFIYGLAAIAIVAGFATSNGNTVSLKDEHGTFAGFAMHSFSHVNALDNN